jgi:hypothetical protein
MPVKHQTMETLSAQLGALSRYRIVGTHLIEVGGGPLYVVGRDLQAVTLLEDAGPEGRIAGLLTWDGYIVAPAAATVQQTAVGAVSPNASPAWQPFARVHGGGGTLVAFSGDIPSATLVTSSWIRVPGAKRVLAVASRSSATDFTPSHTVAVEWSLDGTTVVSRRVVTDWGTAAAFVGGGGGLVVDLPVVAPWVRWQLSGAGTSITVTGVVAAFRPYDLER